MTKTTELSINDELRATMHLIEQFSDLITDETEALRKADFKMVDKLQLPKKEIAKHYQDQVSQLQDRRAEILKADNQLRDNFIATRLQFTKLLTENMTALENVKLSSRRIVNHIIGAARSAMDNQPNYGASGQSTTQKKPVSISIDQQL